MGEAPERVGVVVRRLRVERGWSVRSLATRAGMSATHLARIERLEASPTEETIRALARALGVPVRRLLDDAYGAEPEVADGVALTPGFRDAVRHLLIEIGIPLARQPEAERLVLATTRAICVSVQAERTTPDAAADGTSSAER